MIIDRIEPIALRVPFERRAGDAGSPAPALHLLFCRVTTRSGLVGYGETLCLRAAMQASLAAAMRDVVAPLFIGQSVEQRQALNLETRRRFASFGRAGTILNALGAVDTALWDIAGKAAGQSLSTMLGGARRKQVPVMASLDRFNHAGRVRARVEQALQTGVAAVKVHEFDLDVIEEARRPVGADIPFVADCNNAHELADINRDAARWRALNLLWLEDPFWPPEDVLGMPALPGIPIGLGADLGSAEQLAHYAKAPAVAVAQPDVGMIGGVTESIRALAALNALDVSVAPHTPFVGPAALASLHLIAAMEATTYFATIDAEDHMDPFGIGLTRWKPALDVPVGPGLGHDPDPAWLKRHAIV
jgi:L-alanine-DL-glutamate epimerase-like enolase superfamily enzyme